LKHQMVINVTDPHGHKREVLKGGEICLRDRLLSALLGSKHRILVLVPADSVESVAIREVGIDGGEAK
jgi:hypothetical protein